jgi:hypothetical protein
MQELCYSNNWSIRKTFYQEKNVYFIPASILYWTGPEPRRVEIPGLKRIGTEFTQKSQELTYANISNTEKSAKNTYFSTRNRNLVFSASRGIF